MQKLSQHFDQLLSGILPPESRLEQAKQLTTDVRDFLEDCDKIATVEPHTRLIGSYACSTAIASVRDMKDVDLLVFVDPTYKSSQPSAVLRELKTALESYPAIERIETTTQRRSINLYLQGHDFHLDIVPAIAGESTDEPLQVPDRLQKEWIASHPLGYVKSLSQMNQDNFGKITKLIRLFKHWRDVHMQIMRPKSYWLSCLVYNLSADVSLTYAGVSFAEIFRYLMMEIQQYYTPILEGGKGIPSIKDPMLNNDLTVGHWIRKDFETFMNRVNETVSQVSMALDDNTDKEKAITIWQEAFGEDWFPEYVEPGLTPKAIRSTGQVSFAPACLGETIEIREHRFYGQE